MEQFLAALKEYIEKSPLGYIKGSCRLNQLTSSEWDGCLDDDDFFTGFPATDRTISFAAGDTFIGDLVVEKEILETSKTDDDENLRMTLDIRKEGYMIIIHIYCLAEFPGLHEFAEFVAYIK